MSKKEMGEEEWTNNWHKRGRWGKSGMGGGGMYGLGFLGALIYYLQHATSFWMGLLGIVKAIFWPGFLVYHLMLWLKM